MSIRELSGAAEANNLKAQRQIGRADTRAQVLKPILILSVIACFHPAISQAQHPYEVLSQKGDGFIVESPFEERFYVELDCFGISRGDTIYGEDFDIDDGDLFREDKRDKDTCEAEDSSILRRNARLSGAVRIFFQLKVKRGLVSVYQGRKGQRVVYERRFISYH